MKTYSGPCQAALDSGEAMRCGALKIGLATPFLHWGGLGIVTLESEDYVGLGDRLMLSVFSGQLGSAEIGATATLSGVDPDVAAEIDLVSARGADVVGWELIFDKSGRTLLNADPIIRGIADQLSSEETPGGTSTLTLQIEGASRGLGRRSGRMSTDADQRLIKSNDASLQHMAYAGTVKLYWGGKPPAQAHQALANTNGNYLGQYAAGLRAIP